MDGTIFHRHKSGSRFAHVVHFTSAFYTPGEVTLTWQAPDEGETVTGYKVYRYRWTGGASDSCETIRIATVGSGTTSYTDSATAPDVMEERPQGWQARGQVAMEMCSRSFYCEPSL